MISRRTLLSGLAAATLGVSPPSMAQTSLEERLQEDLGDDDEEALVLTRKTDSVLADLWDNVKDSAYERL